MPTTYDTGPYVAALTAAGLPASLTWTVQVNPRRKRIAWQVQPGGAVLFSVPPGASPDRLRTFAQASRGRLVVLTADASARGAIRPKELVSGEGFRLFGTNYRLSLVDDGPAITGGPGPSTWSGIRTWQLTMRRDQASAALIIEWYRRELAAWLDKYMPPLANRHGIRPGLAWEVRPFRAGNVRSWATYHSKTHRVFFCWQVAQFPAELARHVVAHELAHAARPGGKSHGPEWESKMDMIAGPGWRDREQVVRRELDADVWHGDVAQPRPVDPFVSAWAGTAVGGAR